MILKGNIYAFKAMVLGRSMGILSQHVLVWVLGSTRIKRICIEGHCLKKMNVLKEFLFPLTDTSVI